MTETTPPRKGDREFSPVGDLGIADRADFAIICVNDREGRSPQKEREEMSESRESVAEFLARGGTITKGRTKKAKGFTSLSSSVRTGTSNRGREAAIRAAIKFERAAGK